MLSTVLASRGEVVASATDDTKSTATPQHRLVVATFDEQGVPTGLGDVVADMLIRAIDAPDYQLLERRQVNRVLEEQAFATSDLTQPGEAVRYGRLVDTRFVIVGTVYRVDGSYIVSARMVDSETGVIQESCRGVVQFRTVDEMASRVAELARVIGLRTGPTPPHTPEVDAPAPKAPSTVRDFLEQVGDSTREEVQLSLGGEKGTVREGSDLRLRIECDRAGYLSLFVVDAAGSVAMLVPNDRVRELPVQPNSVISVPGDIGFRLTARPPYGATRIKAVVTKDPLPLAGSVTAGETLRRVQLGEIVSGTTPNAGADWASAELEFLVVPKDGEQRVSVAMPRPISPESPAISVANSWAVLKNAMEELGADCNALPAASRAALRWPLRTPFDSRIDIAWSARPPDAEPYTVRIGVVDADFDPDDPYLATSFHALAPEVREEMRAEIRRNGRTPFRHGNRVASIIGGEAPWLPAVLPGVPIVPIRITTTIDAPSYRAPRGGADELLAALRRALGEGCRVVNLSLAVPLDGDALRAFAADPVWGELERAKVVVVCAAGNNGADLDRQPIYPACLDRPNIMCVGAVGVDGAVSVWDSHSSSHGAKSVDLFAPGSWIAVSNGGTSASLASGTSYACAFVTGAVAQIIQHDSSLSAADVVRRLVERSRPLPAPGQGVTGQLLQWPRDAR
jgi:subtilisin family serine protease/TolB-like protein